MCWIKAARWPRAPRQKCAPTRPWSLRTLATTRRGSVLEVENLVSRYGRIEALHGVSLKVSRGEIVTLVGSNGAGKTTLLQAISGVQPIARGRILLEGKEIAR